MSRSNLMLMAVAVLAIAAASFFMTRPAAQAPATLPDLQPSSGQASGSADEAGKATRIAVIDVDRLMSESSAAKSIQDQIKTLRETMQSEISKIESELKANEKKIVEKRKTMKAEEFAKEKANFEKQIQAGREKVMKHRQAMDEAVNKAVGQLRQNIVELVAEVAKEGRYDLVITRQNVILGTKALDRTDDVMALLNNKIKNIKVEAN